MKSHVEKPSFSCKLCQNSFAALATLQLLVTFLTPPCLVFAPVVGKQFKAIFKICGTCQAVILLHKTWRCQKCNQKFVCLEYLKEHRQTHRTKCDLCEKTFRYKSNFNIHMYTHNNPPNCDVCTKTFANYRRLAEHKIIHTDEKPFKCESCPKSFNNGGSLSRHRRQHDPDKKQCEQCAGGFIVQNS